MSRQLWQIGDPAASPRQFSDRWYPGTQARQSAYSPVDTPDPAEPEPVFEVGRSDIATHWPAVQPGPLDAGHGWRPASATIRFDAPAGSEEVWHELQLNALASHGPCPDLIVTVNGRCGLVLLDPVREDRAHAPMPPSPISGPIDRVVPLRPGLIRSGRNEIILTTHCLEEVESGLTKTRPHLPHLGVWFGSALSWRGLSLAAGTTPAEPSLRLRPTPLYVERDGELLELVDLELTSAQWFAAGTATLRVGPHELASPVDGVDFGDARIRFAVPAGSDPQAETEADVTLELDGRRIGLPRTLWRPARRWTLHLIPHVHLDIGYTDNQAKVIELHGRNIDRVTGILRRTPDYAFTVDGSMILETFLRSRTEAPTSAALEAVQAGRIGVNAFYALFLAGVASLEECYRAAYFSARLRRDLDLPMRTANLTDVPSYPQAIPSILAALGLPGFFGIANHTRGGNPDSDTLHLLSPVRWRGPDGAEVVAYFSDSYSQLRFLCADPPSLAGMAASLPRFAARYDRPDYAPHDLPIVGTHADNEDVADGYADLVERWNARYAYPRLRFSTTTDYLDAVRPLAGRLPLLEGDGGSYWEDGVGTQAAAIARYRRAQALMPAAEAMSALVAAADPTVRPDLPTLDEGWRRLLLGCEHTWTAAHATHRPHSPGVTDQRDWKIGQIDEGLRIATDETRRALSQLAELVPTDGPALVVANPTSFAREIEIEVELAADERIETLDGSALPAIRFGSASDVALVRTGPVPAFGYATYAVRRDIAPSSEVTTLPVPSTLETPHYRVAFDPETGLPISLRHHRHDRELLDSSRGWALGDVLYVTGGGTAAGRGLGDEATSLNDTDPTLPPPRLTTRAATMRAEGCRRLPWGWEICAVGAAPSLPVVRTTLRLHDDSDRIDLTVTIVKEAELAKESVYVAFPFAVPDPVVRYDRQQGWVDPARDHQPGACNEWFTVQDAVTVSGVDLCIAWASADAPLFTLGDVVRGRWPRAATPSGTVLSWVMNNYWWTNTPASQDGTVTLRYAFAPLPAYDPVAAWRLGRDLRTPALANLITWLDKGTGTSRLPAAGRLLDATLPLNVDASVFAGRFAGGVVVRLRELAGTPATVSVRHPRRGPGAAAMRCTATEDPVESLPVGADGTVVVALRPYEVLTVMLKEPA
jgi:alpha-mannosidase